MEARERRRSGSRSGFRSGRRGALVLWLSIAVVVVLIFWGIARSFVTSSLRHEAGADVEASKAELLADSAVAEAEARIGYQVNELDGPLAGELRRQVLAGEPSDLDLAPFVQVPLTEAMLAEPGFRGFSVGPVTARVAFQRQIDNIPYEKRALLVFTATVSSPGLVRRATRRLEVGRWAKVTLTTAPRPFGNFGLFLVNATGLTDPATVNRCRDRALELCRQVRATLTSAVTAGGAAGPPCQELLGQAFDPDGVAPPPEPFSLPDGAALYGLAESREPQKLKHLDLGSRLEDLMTKAERARSELAALGTGGDPAALVQAGRVALTAAIAPLAELWTFQRDYAVLQPSGEKEWTDLASLTYKLRDDYFKRRVHYRLEEGPGHTDLSADLKSLLDRSVSGVISVGNGTRPVTVSGPVAGRVIVLVGPGGANLRSVNASEESTGMVTVVCASGPVRVSGKNSVSLLLVDSADGSGSCQLTMDADARIHGSLIATSVPTGLCRSGELERDDRVFSGFTEPAGLETGVGDRFFVGLSPRITFRRMVRP